MDDSPRIWLIIAATAGVTNLLRAGPVLLLFRHRLSTTGALFKFLEYGSYVIIGGLISGSVVTTKTLGAPSAAAAADSVGALVVVAFSFGLATRVRQPIVCLAAGLSFFLVLALVRRLI